MPFIASTPVPPVPVVLEALDSKNEKKLVCEILKELKENYGVKICTNPSFERGMATPVTNTGSGRIVLIGASHISRTAEYLPSDTVSLAYPGFKPEKNKIEGLAANMKNVKCGQSDMAVLDLLSNVAYMGTDGDGLPAPAYRADDGRFHVVGTLTTAPPTTLKKYLENCEELVCLLKDTKVLLVCPTPRYLTQKCCSKVNHIDNFGSPDYDDDFYDFQEQHRKILYNWGTSKGLNFELIDPTTCVNQTEPSLKSRRTSAGSPLWNETDGVHLSPDGYRDLACAIMELVTGSDNDSYDDSEDGTASCSTGASKRKHPDSVVTMPHPVKHSRGKGSEAAPVAGWLMGKPEQVNRGRIRTSATGASIPYGGPVRGLGRARGAWGGYRGEYRGGYRAPLPFGGRAGQRGGRWGRWSGRGGR
jgi:hypothetical protein